MEWMKNMCDLLTILHLRSDPSALLRNESGQAATEYALVAMWTVIVVMVSIEAMQAALLNFFQDVASLICLPIP